MLIDTGHRQRIQRLEQEAPHATDEHRGIGVHPPGDAGGSEQARIVGAGQLGGFQLLIAGDPLPQRFATEALKNTQCLANNGHAIKVPTGGPTG